MNRSNDDVQARDLEQRLRDGLRQGALPAAPDALRDRLTGLPFEAPGSPLSRFFTGLRLAALASAAAVMIAFVLIVRALPGSVPVGSGGPSAVAVVPSASVGPSSSAASPAPSASPVPSVEPSVGPSVGPAGLGGFTCGTATVLPPTTRAANPVAQIGDVRIGTHPGYDRIVFEFVGTGRPQLTVAVTQPPFVGDASGQTINVAGSAFLSLKLYDASGYPTYTGPNAFSPGYPGLRALVNTGDYEGYVTWIAGLNGSACYRISTLTSPTRIVIDVQAP